MSAINFVESSLKLRLSKINGVFTPLGKLLTGSCCTVSRARQCRPNNLYILLKIWLSRFWGYLVDSIVYIFIWTHRHNCIIYVTYYCTYMHVAINKPMIEYARNPEGSKCPPFYHYVGPSCSSSYVAIGYYGDYVNVYLFSHSNLPIWFQESLCGRWLLQAFTTVFDVE